MKLIRKYESNIEILKDLQSEILASERKFKILENDIKI